MKKHYLTLLIIAIISLSSCSNGQNSKFNLSAPEFDTQLKSKPTAPLVDVRTPDEFSKGHLQNALNIDCNGTSFDTEIAKFDKLKPIFVYCLSGGRSGQAASKMRADGFKEVYELQGGIMKWRGANFPETTSTVMLSMGMSKQHYDSLLITDKLVLIDFYADWCAPCKKMKPYLEEITKQMDSTVTVIRINADDNKSLLKELSIDELPTLLIYKNGTIAWRHSGYINKENVVAQLK
jgi:thioredoxin 1